MKNRSELDIKISALKPGDHLCCIYETEEEHEKLLTPFLIQGLQRNEKIMYIVDARSSEEILDYLRQEGVEIESYLRKGQLNILSVDESYMSTGIFNPDGMISLLNKETNRALKEGYSALRVTGEMSWALKGLPGSDRLIEYEIKLNHFFPDKKCLAICQYDRRKFKADILLDVLITHPIAIIGTEIYDNFYYIPPNKLMKGEPETARLENRLDNLKERKNQERILRDSELKYRNLIEQLPAITYISSNNSENRTLFISPQIKDILGFNPDEWITDRELKHKQLHPADRSKVLMELEKTIKTGKPFLCEYRMFTKDARIVWIRDNATIITDELGKPGYLQGVMYNITTNRQAEEVLKKAHEDLESKIQNRTKILTEAQRIAHLGNWDWNIESDTLDWSDEIFRIFGLKPREFGATYEAFIASVHPEDRNKVKKAVNKAMTNAEYRYRIEHRVLRPDGSERIVYEKGEVTFRKNKPVRMLGTVQDITDYKKMEEKLARQLKEIQRLKQQLENENIILRKEIKLHTKHDTILGKSPAIMQVLRQIEQVAPTDSVVLLQGETGTGKELIANAIHNLSSRKKQMMVKVNCAAIPSPLIESELFGREKGAYTGALTRQIGRFELANHSTIFLDEVGELSLDLQAKLLRVLQEGAFERLGSPRTIRVDVRIIAASNRKLSDAIARGEFREDLFYRLNVFPIEMPPLRDRTEDIPILVWNFANEFSEKMNKEIQSISQKSMDNLQAYHWPGNIRELRNVIEHAVIISTSNELNIQLPHHAHAAGISGQTLEETERRCIINALEKTAWRIKGKNGAASLLGLKPSTLYAKMTKLDIPTKREKDVI